ncbi:MAG: hypothetical protein JWO33_2179 [Caulobacteraceae bacterium]|nr:hypothetical protein [Caulobacteraceae bacterium]
MQNSYRMSIRNAPSMSALSAESGGDNARLAFGTCFMLWMGSIAATWSVIAFIFSLL